MTINPVSEGSRCCITTAWSKEYPCVLALTRPNGNTTHAGFIRDENGREFGVGEYQTAREAALAADLLAAKLAADRGEELAATELHHGPAMLKPLLAKLQGVPMKEALLQMPLLVQERLQQGEEDRASAAAAGGRPPSRAASSRRSTTEQQPQQAQHAAGAKGAPAGAAHNLSTRWRLEQGDNGAIAMANISGRVIKKSALSVPKGVVDALFEGVVNGSSIQLESQEGGGQEAWQATFYVRDHGCSLHLPRSLKLAVGDVLVLKRKAPLQVWLQVHPAESQVARSYVSSLAQPQPATTHGALQSQRPRKRQLGDAAATAERAKRGEPLETRASAAAGPCTAEGSSAALDPRSGEGSAEQQAAAAGQASTASPPCPLQQSQQVVARVLPTATSPAAAAAGAAAAAAAAEPSGQQEGNTTSLAPLSAPSIPCRPPTSTSSWREVAPEDGGGYAAPLPKTVGRKLSFPAWAALLVLGSAAAASVSVTCATTGDAFQWAYSPESASKGSLTGMAAYMKAVGATPGDVLRLLPGGEGSVEATLWRKGSQEATRFLGSQPSGLPIAGLAAKRRL